MFSAKCFFRLQLQPHHSPLTPTSFPLISNSNRQLQRSKRCRLPEVSSVCPGWLTCFNLEQSVVFCVNCRLAFSTLQLVLELGMHKDVAAERVDGRFVFFNNEKMQIQNLGRLYLNKNN